MARDLMLADVSELTLLSFASKNRISSQEQASTLHGPACPDEATVIIIVCLALAGLVAAIVDVLDFMKEEKDKEEKNTKAKKKEGAQRESGVAPTKPAAGMMWIAAFGVMLLAVCCQVFSVHEFAISLLSSSELFAVSTRKASSVAAHQKVFAPALYEGALPDIATLMMLVAFLTISIGVTYIDVCELAEEEESEQKDKKGSTAEEMLVNAGLSLSSFFTSLLSVGVVGFAMIKLMPMISSWISSTSLLSTEATVATHYKGFAPALYEYALPDDLTVLLVVFLLVIGAGVAYIDVWEFAKEDESKQEEEKELSHAADVSVQIVSFSTLSTIFLLPVTLAGVAMEQRYSMISSWLASMQSTLHSVTTRPQVFAPALYEYPLPDIVMLALAASFVVFSIGVQYVDVCELAEEKDEHAQKQVGATKDVPAKSGSFFTWFDAGLLFSAIAAGVAVLKYRSMINYLMSLMSSKSTASFSTATHKVFAPALYEYALPDDIVLLLLALFVIISAGVAYLDVLDLAENDCEDKETIDSSTEEILIKPGSRVWWRSTLCATLLLSLAVAGSATVIEAILEQCGSMLNSWMSSTMPQSAASSFAAKHQVFAPALYETALPDSVTSILVASFIVIGAGIAYLDICEMAETESEEEEAAKTTTQDKLVKTLSWWAWLNSSRRSATCVTLLLTVAVAGVAMLIEAEM